MCNGPPRRCETSATRARACSCCKHCASRAATKGPWAGWDWEWKERPTRATHADVPVEDGLERLLQPPSLTRLILPYVASESLDLLRSIAAADGRLQLRIERVVPMSRRSNFDKGWIDHNTPSIVKSY